MRAARPFSADLACDAILLQKAAQVGAKFVTFGTSPGVDWHLDDAQVTPDATIIHATHAGQTRLFKVMSPAPFRRQRAGRSGGGRGAGAGRNGGRLRHRRWPRRPVAARVNASCLTRWTRRIST